MGGVTNKERDRRTKRDIDELVDKQLYEMLANDPDLLLSLPDGAKASLIASRLPKAQPVDQDFQKRLLSLQDLLDGLPENGGLQRELSVLRVANHRLHAALESERMVRAACRVQLERVRGKKRGQIAYNQFRKQAERTARAWARWGGERRVVGEGFGMDADEVEKYADEVLGE